MATLYKNGLVNIAKNSTKVYGVDTAWLINKVKEADLILLNGEIYEIQEVNASNEITLTTVYTGENIESGEYTVIKISEQVLAADLAEKIQELVDNYNSRETAIVKLLAEHAKYIAVIKKARLFIDSDGNLAQTDELEEPTSAIIDGVEYPLASSDNIAELLKEMGIN